MNETFKIIRDNLTRSYIFYIPESLYNDIQNSPLKDLITYNDTNTIAFLDKDRITTTNESLFNKVQILTKSGFLEENTFLLLNAQTNLDLEQFGYLLKKYREHLDIHTHITKWMSHNLTKDIINVTEDLKNMFQAQSDIFKTHHELIQKKFGAVEAKLKGIKLNNYYKEKFASPDFKVTVPDLFNSKNKVENKPSKPRKKKKTLISDDEADAFLLESVFNIKMK